MRDVSRVLRLAVPYRSEQADREADKPPEGAEGAAEIKLASEAKDVSPAGEVPGEVPDEDESDAPAQSTARSAGA